jgi:hypothetical protein
MSWYPDIWYQIRSWVHLDFVRREGLKFVPSAAWSLMLTETWCRLDAAWDWCSLRLMQHEVWCQLKFDATQEINAKFSDKRNFKRLCGRLKFLERKRNLHFTRQRVTLVLLLPCTWMTFNHGKPYPLSHAGVVGCPLPVPPTSFRKYFHVYLCMLELKSETIVANLATRAPQDLWSILVALLRSRKHSYVYVVTGDKLGGGWVVVKVSVISPKMHSFWTVIDTSFRSFWMVSSKNMINPHTRVGGTESTESDHHQFHPTNTKSTRSPKNFLAWQSR